MYGTVEGIKSYVVNWGKESVPCAVVGYVDVLPLRVDLVSPCWLLWINFFTVYRTLDGSIVIA